MTDDKFQRFVAGQVSESRARMTERTGQTGTPRGPTPVAAGSGDYSPFKYLVQGSDHCRLSWWDEQRGDLPLGVSFHYRTLLRIGWEVLERDSRLMVVQLVLADMNYQIDGYNLGPMVERLSRYECSEMTVYSPMIHRTPMDQLLAAGETVLTRVRTSDGMLSSVG